MMITNISYINTHQHAWKNKIKVFLLFRKKCLNFCHLKKFTFHQILQSFLKNFTEFNFNIFSSLKFCCNEIFFNNIKKNKILQKYTKK